MAESASGPLPPEKVRLAYATLAAWRVEPTRPVACPACGREGLEVSDRSARPYAEWYVLSCAGCGLNHTVQIPLSPPMGGVD
jgi:hypothetical protein